MAKITYLFGAGASINALPIVYQIPERLDLFSTTISKDPNYDLGNQMFFGRSKSEYIKDLLDDLSWLIKESSRHSSIDTFAKKLSLRRDKTNLRRLKITLSIFFAYEQIRNHVDKRYDAFFASILKAIDSFPENIRILSWNYDAQFELSISEYIDKDDLESSEIWLKVQNRNYINSIGETEPGFGIYKLNGTASCFVKDEFGIERTWLLSSNKNQFDRRSFDKLIETYATAKRSVSHPSFSFSWERSNKVLEPAMKQTKDTNILVVIGYSFPFFNREIDQQIVGNMGVNLLKVYFQSPEAEKIIQRFQAVKQDFMNPKLIPLSDDLDQFFLPPEL